MEWDGKREVKMEGKREREKGKQIGRHLLNAGLLPR